MYVLGSPDAEAMIDLLLSHGASINQVNKKTGWTVLHHACYYHDQKGVGALIERGAALKAFDNSGITPLVHAITGKNSYENTKAFLEAIQKRQKSKSACNNDSAEVKHSEE